jgi:hypothetical protein
MANKKRTEKMDLTFLTTTRISTHEEKARFLEIKRSLISEAVSFPSGTAENKIKTAVFDYSGHETAFLKPGKETGRTVPNRFDMYPLLTYGGRDVTHKFSFEDIWAYLLKIFIIHKGTFIKALVLLYRLCYFYEHKQINGKWRYAPSEEISELVRSLDNSVLREGLRDKFGEPEPLLLFQFLLFADILAWNEDVKYHAPKGEPYFKNMTESSTGRTNAFFSIISAPLLISEFIEDIIFKTHSGGVIDVKLIASVMQGFSRRRGLCVLSYAELQKRLAPYLI